MTQTRRLARLIATLFVAIGAPKLAFAQSPAGTLQGIVTTQGGSIRLPSVQVTVVRDATDQAVAQQLTDGEGRFRFDVAEGKYRISAALDGFQTIAVTSTASAGKTADLPIDLPLAGITERVDVVGSTSVVSSEGTLGTSDTLASRELDQLAPGGGFQAALRLLASVIAVPGGPSIKGGRPSQASVQLGPTTLVDPSTGLTNVSLPDDAIDSVAVLPNPYAVEFGRFSSGLVVIQTRRAGELWKTRLNNVDPTFRTKRGGSPFDVKGIASFSPRLETGGPLIRDRLFLEQTAQFHYGARDVPSRPENELRTSTWFSSFSRIDANLSPRQSLVATGGVDPSTTRLATLGTFTPPTAAVDLHGAVNQVAVTDRSLWSDAVFSESTVQMHTYRTTVSPQGLAPMQLLPETTLGNFFNRQQRATSIVQWVETVSGSRHGVGGLHVYKAGIDLLHSEYDGSSASRPVLIMRSNGTLARRLDFSGPTRQSVHSTDVAVYAQDRYQPSSRWYLEFGGRLDRDGIFGLFNATQRVGTAVLLNEAGTSVLRGGYGLFYERTPSAAGAFGQFETATDARFATDGLTPLGPAISLVHVTAPNLQTPRSATWDLAYEFRLNPMWAFHLGVIDRSGSHELIINPVRSAAMSELLLESTGRSSFRDAEAGVHFSRGSALDLNVTYSRSVARSDLNALTNYFDTIVWPIVGANAYAPANADVPNRVLAKGRAMPTSRWLLIGILDWRSGMPYSVVDEMLDYVGPRNARRFPTYRRLELGIEHRFKILKYQPWIGVRADNALNSFVPTDVQANIGSPAFGTFYNSEYRQFRLQLRFER